MGLAYSDIEGTPRGVEVRLTVPRKLKKIQQEGMPNCPRCLKKYLGCKCSHCHGGAFNIGKGESSFVESGSVTYIFEIPS